VKTTISDLGYADFSEWSIAHSGHGPCTGMEKLILAKCISGIPALAGIKIIDNE
jgi:hypothetical protein